MSRDLSAANSSKADAGSPLVGVIMGSASDVPKVSPVFEVLDSYRIAYETAVISAHRTPELVKEYGDSASRRGVKVIIAAAGLSAALPGALAALVDIPVIGLPLGGGPMSGLDALLSVADMPPGIPVGCVGIDSVKNAALLAVRILGLTEPRVAAELKKTRAKAMSDNAEKNESLRRANLPVWEP